MVSWHLTSDRYSFHRSVHCCLPMSREIPGTPKNISWLVVSTHLKNISQNGNLPQGGVKIKNDWNHHLVSHWNQGISPGTPNSGTPHSHTTTPIRIPGSMGMVWVPLMGRGVPLLGVPGISLDNVQRETYDSAIKMGFYMGPAPYKWTDLLING